MESIKSSLETFFREKLKNPTPVGTSGPGHISDRKEVLDGTAAEKHGHIGISTWASPKLVTFCPVEARPGYRTCEAHEYMDEPSVLSEKAAMLAKLLKKSRMTILYTGAGISTASGISDYATRSTDGVIGRSQESTPKTKTSPLLAQPTKGHRILVAMYRAGLIKGWVQQNHDGLPQKAGLPQSAINEIHGAWFDPSNPVVKMKGNLREDLFASLLEWERDADLCLTLGTSLSGMNADRVAVSCAERRLQGRGLGTVIVNLQRTTQDHLPSLRVFAPIDQLLEAVARELGIPPDAYAAPPPAPAPCPAPHAQAEDGVWMVPYDESGRRAAGGAARALDLRAGARARVTAGPYAGHEATVRGRRSDGHFDLVIERRADPDGKPLANMAAVLGAWFVDEAAAAALPTIPIVTVAPPPADRRRAAAAAAAR